MTHRTARRTRHGDVKAFPLELEAHGQHPASVNVQEVEAPEHAEFAGRVCRQQPEDTDAKVFGQCRGADGQDERAGGGGLGEVVDGLAGLG